MDIESGSMITGKWVNPQTGSVINITDTVIDDNGQMMIITDKGTLDMNTFSINYIQCEDDTVIEEMTKQSTKQNTEAIVENNNQTSNVEVVSSSPTQNLFGAQNGSNASIIDKLFNKIESKPNIKISIEWDDFPTEQVNMLINFLDIDKNEISRYLKDNYLDEYAILEALDNFLKSKI